MFAANKQASSRPKPPAQLRRSQNAKSNESPPPPYEKTSEPDSSGGQHPGYHQRTMSMASVNSNVGSPVIATAHLLGIDLESSKEGMLSEEQIQEKSKEELERLLLKAEAVIRARERELGVAAAVGKQLLETNITLRQRHTSLLSKYPPMLSPGSVILDMPDNISSPVVISTPATPNSFLHSPAPSVSMTHGRRPSASPAQLATLSTQNEELLQALEKLQDETSSANLEGKQKLRRLEKEIAGLRTELESAQQKNSELEEKIDTVKIENDHAKRSDREARVQAMRRGDQNNQDPEPAYSFAPMVPVTPQYKPMEPEDIATSINFSPLRARLRDDYAIPSPMLKHPSENEVVVLSLLISKIEELEKINREILQRHRENDSKLRLATNEADALNKVYENLEEEIDDDEFERSPSSTQPPSSLGSYKGGALGFVYPPPTSLRVKSLRERGSPVSSLKVRDLTASSSSSHGRLRKPLSMSLFDAPSPTSNSPRGEGEQDDDYGDDFNRYMTQKLEGKGTPILMSPSPQRLKSSQSHISLTSIASPLSYNQESSFRGRTLGSELASQWGEGDITPESIVLTDEDEVNEPTIRIDRSDPLSPESITTQDTPRPNDLLLHPPDEIDIVTSKQDGTRRRRKSRGRTDGTGLSKRRSAPGLRINRPETTRPSILRDRGVMIEVIQDVDDEPAENQQLRESQPKEGWGQMILEIWIILQAIIILLVFVYSMARRGPRAIIDAAETKKRSR